MKKRLINLSKSLIYYQLHISIAENRLQGENYFHPSL
jgi:hypothetical protein